MSNFSMNGYFWNIETVSPDSDFLIDRTGSRRVATTDPNEYKIFLSKELAKDKQFLMRVLIHEIGHCVIFSYNLFDEIHRMVYPEYWVEAEEFICNFIADYGLTVFSIARSYLGDYAINIVPKELEKLVA